MKTVDFLGIPIHNLSMDETLSLAKNAILQRKQVLHTVVNAAKIVGMRQKRDLAQSVKMANIINADGMAVVWASRLLGNPLKERVAGIDLMNNLVEMAFINKFKIFFFGAEESVVNKVTEVFAQKYSPEIIGGFRNGYYNLDEEKKIAEEIANTECHILFVAMSSPKKENFLYNYRNILGRIPFIMGVGGSFDVVSGKTKRAPLWMQSGGLEWLYRIYQEPGRMWKRYLVTNTIFIFLVFKQWLKGIAGKN